jgi:hypothetical protein
MSDVAAATSQLVYVILGAPGSGRREVLADLVTDGLDPLNERAHVYLPAGEGARPEDEKIGASTRAPIAWNAELQLLVADAPPAEATHVFILLDGLVNPVDQLEALKPWLAAHSLPVARILTVVHCRLAEKHPALQAWFDACIHFSDVVLLNRREGVANKWMSEFRRRYEDQYLPCVFEMVKAGRVKNPAAILDSLARRMSQFFDPTEWDDVDLEGVEIGESDDEDGDTVRPLDKSELDPDDQPPLEPWLERDAAGRRKRPVPDMRRFLGE